MTSWILSQSGGYEEFHLLGYKPCNPVKIKPTSRRNISPPPPGSKNKPSKKLVKLTRRAVIRCRYSAVDEKCRQINQNPQKKICRVVVVTLTCRVIIRRYRVVHWECGLNQNPLINTCRVVSLHVGTVPSTESVNPIRIHENIFIVPLLLRSRAVLCLWCESTLIHTADDVEFL
jgi:hypothetical protein